MANLLDEIAKKNGMEAKTSDEAKTEAMEPIQTESKVVTHVQKANAQEMPNIVVNDKVDNPNKPVDETGIIAADTVVRGDIMTDGHVLVYGTVIGSIEAKGDVTINGNVTGDVKCRNFTADAGELAINIDASAAVTIHKDVNFKGQIKCADLLFMGKMEGNIIASGKVGLTKDAVIKGSIEAASFACEIGVKLNGKINIK